MVHIYYDSRTGNVQRFMDKLTQVTGWHTHKITEDLCVEEAGHLVTFTTNFGQIPESTLSFVRREAQHIISVTSSGNRNWGRNFGLAADKIAADFDIPLAFKFELSGTMEDINQFIDIIKNNNYDSERGSKKLDIA
ncbi:class Ib ribonucleoside-diphosphate reductase assembly flavoprotein NrdI [Sphingobacterium sp. SYP-B4668]|uniref:class Ib ribonucleoside-diphosphate reductase assembly flavoprotein NrdI n=1 Tax=Sphingobacterium sp. SYP-B4668 TaxID=2996035 RepID=UPI0022DE4737|nr:class Ib ribonucleoside-diphosphate reductase assembly flavoprotein NrdI [Sphingobacterium sp. SYP-B4668]